MAKTESTAVNQLISSVQSNRQVNPEPSEDLLFSPPKPRMTATIPPTHKSAGEVAPLPRRVAGGTSQHQLPEQPVRMMSAPPSRTQTIPPLPAATRPSKSTLPPPRPPTAAPAGTPAPQRMSPTTIPPTPVATASAPRPAPPVPTRTAPPPTTPVAAPFAASPAVPPPISARVAAPVPAPPIVAPPAPPPPVQHSAIDRTGDAVSADSWFEPSRMVEKVDQTWVGTMTVEKQREPLWLVKKLAAPAAAMVLLGVMIGGYLAFNGEGGHKHHAAKAQPPSVAAAQPAAALPAAESSNAATASAGATQPEPPAPAPAPAAAPAPAPAPAAEPPVAAPAPAAEPAVAATAPAGEPAVAATAPVAEPAPAARKLVDIRIDSSPAGATVMLVSNGKTSFLGTTPIATSLDAAGAYDVVFALEGKPTQSVHLDPSKTHHLDVALGKGSAPAVAAATPAPAPAAHHHASRPAVALADPGFDTPKPAPKPRATPATITSEPPTGGTGTLMVSSKPPCELIIDGKTTGLTTPQRSIALPVGAHKVTFVNATQNIKKTVAVSISADHPTKLIQNLMN